MGASASSGALLWRRRLVLAALYSNVTLYAFCFMMQHPVLPELVDKLANGEDGKLEWAKLQTAFAFVQLLGGLVSGFLSDRLGARSVILVSAVASVFVYALQGYAGSILDLYLSRIPALLQHTYMGTTAYVAAITPRETRSQSLGYIQLAYGVGMATGPLVGGYVGEHDLAMCSRLAAVGSAVAAVITLALPDEGTLSVEAAPAAAGAEGGKKEKEEEKEKEKASLAAEEEPVGVIAALQHPLVMRAVLLKVLAASAMAVWQASFSMVAKETFGFGPKHRGYALSYLSVWGMLVISLKGIQRLETALGDGGVTVAVGGALSASFLFVPAAAWYVDVEAWEGVPASTVLLAVLLAPMAACGTVLRNTLTSAFTKATDPALSGTMLGIDMALSSAVRLYAPGLGVAAYAGYGLEGLSATCAGLTGLMVVAAALLHKPSASEVAAGKKEKAD